MEFSLPCPNLVEMGQPVTNLVRGLGKGSWGREKPVQLYKPCFLRELAKKVAVLTEKTKPETLASSSVTILQVW